MRGVLMAAAAVALAACARDEPPPAPQSVAPPVEAPVLIARVGTLEVGRTRTGFMLAALGEADGVGWRAPRLRPAREGLSPDGFLEFEFVAIPPAEPGPGVQRLRADAPLPPQAITGAAGLRVIARQGDAEGVF
jgi:hypothetical protein